MCFVPVARQFHDFAKGIFEMKINVVLAAVGLALALPLPALAADVQSNGTTEFEWRQVAQAGPRSTPRRWKRVPRPENRQVADCACDMMRMSSDECMNSMHGAGANRADG